MMEFEDEHDEEQEEEEDDDEDDITIPPPHQHQPSPMIVTPPQSQPLQQASYNDSLTRPRVNPGAARSGVTRYRECLKNHAVSIGGHAVDGCGEFMPAGEDGTLDALKCAACNCHRNFHRKETTDGGAATTPPPQPLPQQQQPPPPPPGYPHFSAYYRTPPAPPSGYLHVTSTHRPLPALPSTSGGTHSGGGDMGDDMSIPSSSGGGGGGSGGGTIMNKKRFRTKFSQEQKDKMFAFAEKLGWRIQKHDEAAVQQFCAEVQIKRQVLKVWMHNNKHTLGKKP